MKDYIIISVLLVVAVMVIRTLVKRAGRKGCCGSGSDYTPKKKKLKNVIATKTFRVEGMHCEKCANRVTETINDMPYTAAVVDLKKGTMVVSYVQEIPDDVIAERPQRLGYQATAVEGKRDPGSCVCILLGRAATMRHARFLSVGLKILYRMKLVNWWASFSGRP